MDHLNGARIVAVARDCIDAPFRVQGRHPATGLDCIGLIVWVGRQLDIVLEDRRDYTLSSASEPLVAGLLGAGLLPSPDPVQGDVVLFRFDAQRRHLGIASDTGLIHAHAGLRRVCEHRLEPDWRAAVEACFRYPGISGSGESAWRP